MIQTIIAIYIVKLIDYLWKKKGYMLNYMILKMYNKDKPKTKTTRELFWSKI